MGRRDQRRSGSTPSYPARVLATSGRASAAVERKLQAKLLESTEQYAHLAGGVQDLREAFDAAGLTPQNSFTLEGIFRTQTALAYQAGHYQTYQDPDVQEELWGYLYVTVGDDRVRAEHVGFEGVRLPKDDPFWKTHWPPNGWACRCTVIPLFDEERPVPPPATVDVDGKLVRPEPDAGFAFNPGEVFGATDKDDITPAEAEAAAAAALASAGDADRENQEREYEKDYPQKPPTEEELQAARADPELLQPPAGLPSRSIDPTGEVRKLTKNEKAGLRDYSGHEEYASLNAMLRGGQQLSPQQEVICRRVDSALSHLPAHREPTYRVLDVPPAFIQEVIDAHVVGRQIAYNAYTSSSRVQLTEGDFPWDAVGRGRVRLVLHGQTGRDIEAYSQRPEQHEVLFGRGSQWIVVGQTRRPDGGYDIEMREVVP